MVKLAIVLPARVLDMLHRVEKRVQQLCKQLGVGLVISKCRAAGPKMRRRWRSSARFDSNWLLVDVISSSKRGAGALLALQVYLLSCRSKQYKGVIALAVSKSGKKMFEALGFATHSYKDDGMHRTLCYATADSLSQKSRGSVTRANSNW